MDNTIPNNSHIKALGGDVIVCCPDTGRELMLLTPSDVSYLVGELRGIGQVAPELAELCARLDAAAQSAARQQGVASDVFRNQEFAA